MRKFYTQPTSVIHNINLKQDSKRTTKIFSNETRHLLIMMMQINCYWKNFNKLSWVNELLDFKSSGFHFWTPDLLDVNIYDWRWSIGYFFKSKKYTFRRRKIQSLPFSHALLPLSFYFINLRDFILQLDFSEVLFLCTRVKIHKRKQPPWTSLQWDYIFWSVTNAYSISIPSSVFSKMLVTCYFFLSFVFV